MEGKSFSIFVNPNSCESTAREMRERYSGMQDVVGLRVRGDAERASIQAEEHNGDLSRAPEILRG
jgi:hypothetical protein